MVSWLENKETKTFRKKRRREKTDRQTEKTYNVLQRDDQKEIRGMRNG